MLGCDVKEGCYIFEGEKIKYFRALPEHFLIAFSRSEGIEVYDSCVGGMKNLLCGMLNLSFEFAVILPLLPD